MLDAATFIIDAYTGRKFQAYTAVKTYLGTEVIGNRLWLWDDLRSVNQITVQDLTLSPDVYSFFPANPPYAQIWFWDVLILDRYRITIDGTWGYSATPSPDIVQLCNRVAAFLYKQKDSQILDVAGMTETGQVTLPRGLPKDMIQLMDTYRRIR
jgi:hypothetical protein